MHKVVLATACAIGMALLNGAAAHASTLSDIIRPGNFWPW